MPNLLRNIVLAAALACSPGLPLFASEDDDIIQTFNNTHTVYLFASDAAMGLDVLPSEWDHPIKIMSNTGSIEGLGLSYRGYGIRVSGSMLEKREASSDFGTTEYRDIYLSRGSRKYFVTARYQDYRGFYVDNPGRIGLGQGDSGTALPSLEIRQVSINACYNFRDNFSMSAFTDHSERQNDSDWSHMLMASYTSFTISSDGPVLPEGAISVPEDARQYRGGSYHGLSIQPGIGGTWAARKFYLTGFMLMGGGIMLHKSDTGESDSLKLGPMFKMFLGMALGYNGDAFFSGVNVTGDTTETANINGYQVTTSAFHMECVVGCRFSSGLI